MADGLARPSDILVGYSPEMLTLGNQPEPLEVNPLEVTGPPGSYPEWTGGVDTHYEDFTSGLRDFVAARATAARDFAPWDSTLGGGADFTAIVLGVDWTTDSDEKVPVGKLSSYIIEGSIEEASGEAGGEASDEASGEASGDDNGREEKRSREGGDDEDSPTRLDILSRVVDVAEPVDVAMDLLSHVVDVTDTGESEPPDVGRAEPPPGLTVEPSTRNRRDNLEMPGALTDIGSSDIE